MKGPDPYRCVLCGKFIAARPDLAHKPGAPTRADRLRNHMLTRHGIKVAA